MPVTTLSPDSVDWRLEAGKFDGSLPRGLLAGTIQSWNNSRTHDGPIKDWKQRIRRLEEATTSMTGSKTRFSNRDYIEVKRELLCISGPQTGQRQGFKLTGCTFAGYGLPNISAQATTRADREAITKFVSKATAARQSLMGVTFVGELAEAISMIRRPGQELFKHQYRYLDDVKKRLSRKSNAKLKDVPKIIGGTWLENAFGWQPLINDIKSGAEGLSRILTYTPPHKVVTGYGFDIESPQAFTDSMPLGTGVTMRRNFQDTRSASVRFRGCVAGVYPGFNGALETFGMNLSSLVPSLYELIPYSFLVDYFSNLGSVISGCSFASGSVKWCVKTIRQVQTRTLLSCDFTTTPLSGWVETSYSASPGGQPCATSSSFSRHSYAGSFVPSFTVQVPGSSLKWLNIGALAASSRSMSRVIASKL